MLKKVSLIGLIVSILIVAFAVGYPALAWALSDSADKTVAIIGGADGPTAIMITRRLFFGSFLGVLTSFGIPLLLISLFCLIFPSFVQKNFSVKTTALALGISATGCLGLWCVLECLAILAFASPSEHPIAYPASIIVGVLSLILFIILFALYCKARKGETRILGVVFDVFTGGMFMLFFLLSEAGAIELARDVYHMLERLWW